MADLSAVSSRATASGRDVLLATKLHVPGLGAGLVPRARLTERLEEGLGRGLVLVCAPAGYGKTVLLAGWRPSVPGHRPRGCRWMPGTTTLPGSGVMRWLRWIGHGRGSPTGWGRCSARPRRPHSSRW